MHIFRAFVLISISTILYGCQMYQNPPLTTIPSSGELATTSSPPVVTDWTLEISQSTPTDEISKPPTLTASEREFEVRELLRTNAGCELPCWWGIEPGKSTWEEVQSYLQSVGARYSAATESGDEIIYGAGGFDLMDLMVLNRIGFQVKDSLIDVIRIDAYGEHNLVEFQDIWTRFSPESILTNFGPPSRIMIESDFSGPRMTDRAGYGLWFWYDNEGFVVQYSDLVDLRPPVLVCPTFRDNSEIYHLSIYMQSADNPRKLESITYFNEYRENFISLEEALGISVEEFSSRMLGSDVDRCFETVGDLWK
jgi:hypothetical protein